MTRKPPFTVKRAFRDASVRVAANLRVSDRGEACAIEAAADISSIEARDLAAALIAAADRVDEVAAKKTSAEARRQAWRDREVAAGRMQIMSAEDFFGRGRR